MLHVLASWRRAIGSGLFLQGHLAAVQAAESTLIVNQQLPGLVNARCPAMDDLVILSDGLDVLAVRNIPMRPLLL